MRCRAIPCVVLLSLGLTAAAGAADAVIPHGQSAPPGPALTPAEAIARMTVPDGFTVELVAAEPDIVNPVAMTFDEQGRIWITESLEYPRFSAGPGRDRIKVLEDTDGDGRADKFTIFADGLNIPSGIAVGHGGVWVANAPDILFLQDTDGDGRADKREVVVTGFGRHDTHELPNSLTWGPDGYLYGLNGVFNQSHVEQNGKAWDFTCAVFRIDPRTREFSLFAQGTSNPWGIAWDADGSMFLSACVIDHLWHIAETGYYHRQGGPYPPFVWKLGSIVGHKHQKAAYCGIHYFDSDAYPEEYRGKLYMGNIHGNCVNCDALERHGATYRGTPRPDLLSANDAWFMCVSQKTGPDGCLYLLDWYDRYHCYQDARRDAAGIDRLKGRLYRVRYKNTPRAPKFDLAAETDAQLIARLASPNIFFRDIATRLLQARSNPQTAERLAARVMDDATPQTAQRHALWALIGSRQLDAGLHARLLDHADPTVRAWAVRAAGNRGQVAEAVREKVVALAADESPDVRLQVVIAAGKIVGIDPLPVLIDILSRDAGDVLIPHIVWENLHPLLAARGAEFVRRVEQLDLKRSPVFSQIVPRAIDRMLAEKQADLAPIAVLLGRLTEADPQAAGESFALLAERIQSGELNAKRLDALRAPLENALAPLLAGRRDDPLTFDAALLAATVHSPDGITRMRKVLASTEQPADRRARALEALIAAGDDSVLSAVRGLLTDPSHNPMPLRAAAMASLGRLDAPAVAPVVLDAYPRMEPELQPKAVELLTQRASWAKPLLAAIAAKTIPADALNVNQARRLLDLHDAELATAVRRQWGTIRQERNPAREQIIAQMRTFLRQAPGNAHRGEEVFKKVCGQCHAIYGAGQDVGPDITANGRASFAQLLSNVFDPSLVVGAAYQAQTVVTADGRVLNGLVVEDNAQRIILKMQGGKRETIAREDVEESRQSQLSLMPEGLEKQLKPQELADLFAYLTLTRPPGDPLAASIPGTREVEPRSTNNPKKFDDLVGDVLPGFHVARSGDGGVAVLRDHLGREAVLQTHPVNQKTPCVLTHTADIPAGSRLQLRLAVSHHPQGDWRLVVKGNGETLYTGIIGPKTTVDGWAEIAIDLTRFAGHPVKLELQNAAANNWAWEYGYWGGARFVSESPRETK